MRLKKSQFKKIITVICFFLGLAVFVCAADIFLIPYISSKNAEIDTKLTEADNYGGYDLLENKYTTLTEEIKNLKNNYNDINNKISEAKTQRVTLEALYNEAEINNQLLKASSSNEYAALQEKYETLQSQYNELLDKYNKLK